MADIIIRTAKKDYVCDVCGHIIRAGEEYLDKVITHDGKAVRHERYHDECPFVDDLKLQKFIRTFMNSKDIVAVDMRTCKKYHVIGIANSPVFRVEMFDWSWNRVPDVSIEEFLKEYEYE